MADNQKNRVKQDYNPSEIESKWQSIWDQQGIYSPNLDAAKKPFYNLMMFPYPSAEGMHVGNMYAFTGADVYGRFKRMQGFDVFEPIGLDGFGIHSENYAIKVGQHPKEQAKISEKNFYRQLHATGNGFDWSRKLETYDPSYYKWTQWLFIQLFKAGLAYRGYAKVNWCPSCKTVLADEQVIEAKCERCESEVTKKELEQWFFRITKYADRLLNNIDKLDWTEKVKIAQRQWIGRSEGAKATFSIEGKYHFVLLHGFTGNPEANFFPWLKRELEKRGHTVEVPLLPNTNNPDINEQARFVLNNCRFNSNTVVLGHSLGSVIAAKVCETLNAPIKKLVLAAGFLQPKFLDKKRPFEKTFTWKFDFSKIKKNTSEIVILRATNDTAVPQERSDYIQSVVGGNIIDFEAENDHITGEKEPVVMTNMLPSISVFTTRPDTLYGATFLVLSPEHPFVQTIDRADIQTYVLEAKKKTEQERMTGGNEKTGVFTNFYAINPVNNEKIPVWIADYAVMGYGTGALFGDAHDERDVAFAKKYGIPLKPTLITGDKERDRRIMNLEECFTGYGTLIDSGEFSGLSSAEAKKRITAWLKEHKAGGPEITCHLRDWLISRQRYWGPPIPMIYCDKCGWQPVPEKDLPVLLPDVKDWKPLGTGMSPLANHPEFYKVACPNCGREAKRETDVSDTFLDSAWYFFRYTSTDIESRAFDRDRVKKWLPVEMYIGGAEHSVLHLLYSRFITMVLSDLGYISFDEPFSRFFAHGLLIKEAVKMSKSKGNVVAPDQYIAKFGADTLRMYLMFLGPFSQGGDFYDTGIEGMHRFLNRVWRLFSEATRIVADQNAEKRRSAKISVNNQRQSASMMHKTIKKVTEDISNLRYNTAIASLMTYYNFLSKQKFISKEEAETFFKLLAPFAPHMTEELFHNVILSRNEGSERDSSPAKRDQNDKKRSIHLQAWPKYNPKFLVEDEVTIVVQVNGKVRDTIKVQSAKCKVQSYVEELARESQRIEKYLQGKQIKRVVYVEEKISVY